MSCNWEFFELRVIVFTKAIEAGGRGLAGQGPKFFSVTLDLRSLGIPDFQGSNYTCNFTTIFSQLISKRAIPFACSQKNNEQGNFGIVEAAGRNKEILPAAKLYVHNQKQSDGVSVSTGFGVLLQGVKVISTFVNNGDYYMHLSGHEASSLNF